MRHKEYISFDWALKRLLRDKANFDVLEGFLTTLLEKPIKIQRLLESESNKDRSEVKSNRVDLLAEDEQGELLLIEVQGESEFSYFHRMIFGASKLVTDYVELGSGYENVKKVYSVNIVYFDLGQGTDCVYRGKTEFRGIHDDDVLRLSPFQQQKFNAEEVSQLFPEYYILKVNDFNRWSKVPLEQWLYFLANSDIPEDADAPGLSAAREKLRFMKMNREEQRVYEHYISERSILENQMITAKGEGRNEGLAEGRAEGRAEGLAEGRAEGRAEANIDTARKLKAMGMLSVQQIADATGLSIDEINQL